MGIFGNKGGSFGGLFNHPPPAAGDYGQPRTPFARVFDPEAQRTTLSGFLGRVAGNPTGTERAGAAAGGVFRKFAELQAGGLNTKQALIEVTKDPSFMDAFINAQDPGQMIYQLLSANSQFDQDATAAAAGADPLNVAPGGAVFQPGQGEIFRNPTTDAQTTGAYIEGAGLTPEETQAVYRTLLDAEASGDDTEKEAATRWLVNAGKITEEERQMILSGLIGVKQDQDAEGRTIDRGLWDFSKNQPWVPALSAGASPPAEGGDLPLEGSDGTISGGEGGNFGGGGTSASYLQRAGEFAPLYEAAGQKYGVPAELLARQGQAESGFNPNAKSPAGAMGIAQFMPATAKEYGVNPSDPASSIDGQARYMARYTREFGGDVAAALVAYNWGPKNARDWVKKGKPGSMLPGETRAYLAKILGGPGQRGFTDKVYGPLAAIPDRPGRRLFGGPGGDRLQQRPGVFDPGLQTIAPGFGTEAEVDNPDLNTPEAETPEGISEGFKEITGMSGAEASLYGSGTGPAFAEFMGNFLSDVSGNPKYLQPRIMASRNALRTIRENTILYYGKLGRESAQEAQRIQELTASLGSFKTPADALLKLGELRKNILRAVQRDHDIAEGPTSEGFGVVRQADAKERIRDAELILSQIGDESQLSEAYYYATHNPQKHLLDYFAQAFTGAAEVGESELNRELPGGGTGTPVDNDTFKSIKRAMRLEGTMPTDEQIRGMTQDQLDELLSLADKLDAKGAK